MNNKGRRRNQEEGLCDCLRPITRFWGIATAVVLSGVGVDVTVHGHTAGILIIISSIIVFFLEITWVITLFLQLCRGDEYSRGYLCWEKITWLGGWRLAPPYISLGVALIVWPQGLWLSPVAGGQLLVLAVLHLLEIFRSAPQGHQDTLLPQSNTECEFEKYEDITEVLDDTLPGPIQENVEEEQQQEI